MEVTQMSDIGLSSVFCCGYWATQSAACLLKLASKNFWKVF